MRCSARTVLVLALAATLISFGAEMALAQAPTQTPPPAQRPAPSKPPIEFSATYGSMWGGNLELYSGKLRTATGGAIGLALDVPIRPGMWIEASYNRQEGALDWDPRGGTKTSLTDMSVNIWHLGTIRALGQPGAPFVPYVQGSLGATYFSPEASQILIDGEMANISSSTMFSIAFGAGFKAYLGEAKKIGLRGSFKVISSLYDAGGGVFFGGGGASVGVTGSGIWQYEAALGLTVKLGG